MLLTLHNVVKRFGRLAALDGVSCTIEAGRLVAIIGMNGAGKTTLLHCCASIAMPTTGEVRFDDQPLRRDDMTQRRRLLYQGDFPIFLPGHTILDHLALVLRCYGRLEAVTPAQVVAVLSELHLLPLAERKMVDLSRGQGTKVMLAAAMLVEPELWLLDEPFAAGMDPQGLAVLRRSMRAAVARGGTVLYTTQLLEVVERHADRVLVLDEGRLTADLGGMTLAEMPAEGVGSLAERLGMFRDHQP